MFKTTSDGSAGSGKAVTRRQFLKTGAGIAALVMADPIYLLAQEKRQNLDTGLTIDKYVEMYASDKASDASDKAANLIRQNRATIGAFAIEYKVPANLLSTIIAIEQQGTDPDNSAMYRFWETVKHAPVVSGRDSSEGIAQLKISVASWLLAGIYRVKGEGYVVKEFPAVKDYKETLAGMGRISDYNSLDMTVRYRLTKDLRAALESSNRLSIELAAKYISYLKERVKSVHRISDANYVTNPVAILLTLNAYRKGEREIDNLRFSGSLHKESIDSLTMLRTGSGINRMFSREKYQVIPDTRFHGDNRNECAACSAPMYRAIAGNIQDAISLYQSNLFVKASTGFRHASDLAYSAAKGPGTDDEKREFYKLSLYSLSRASDALARCGVARIKVHERGKIVQKDVAKVLEDYIGQYRRLYSESGDLGGSSVVLPKSKGQHTIPTSVEMQKTYRIR